MGPGSVSLVASLISDQRRAFHDELIASGTLSITNGIASNADGSQHTSRFLALHMADALGASEAGAKLSGQSAGKSFEAAVRNYLDATFPRLTTLRPGTWSVLNVGGSRAEYHLAQYEPFTHLNELARAIERDETLVSVLGNRGLLHL